MSTHTSTEDVPVQPAVVALAVIIVPVLVAAFLMLYLFPDLGAERFAWSIDPLMSSMMLGATYIGGAYFFASVVRSRKWRHVWLGLLPVTAFAGTLGVATVLHWDVFPAERLGFQLWAFLYFAVPPILPVLWYRNQRLAAGTSMAREGELPTPSRWAFGALGVVLTVAGVAMFLVPELAMGVWPWTLSPLTTRTLAAMYVLPGLTGLGLYYDGSWSGARYLLGAMAISIALMLVAAYVARADFDWANPTAYLFVGSLVGILLLIAYTYAARTEGGA
jgi:hypothetical protein